MIDVLNKNQALSERKRLEKLQHIRSAQTVPKQAICHIDYVNITVFMF